MNRPGIIANLTTLLLAAATASAAQTNSDGVFVRFRLVEPADVQYYVRLGGYIHKSPWYLQSAVVPAGADEDAEKRLAAGQWTDWFDLKAHAGERLHGRMNRSGGVAEFPNVTADFVIDGEAPDRKVEIELATSPSTESIVKRFEETYRGSRTSFLVSPNLAADAESLESLSEMQGRHLRWARETTGGKRISPNRHIIQTSFYGATIEGAEVLWLLGFNVVGNQTDEIHAKFPELRRPGHTHDVAFGPAATREEIDALMQKLARRYPDPPPPGTPFGFADEICCRPRIGDDAKALEHFHNWLAEQKIDPAELDVERLSDVKPIETPEALHEREKANGFAARRIFYYTSRFRQMAGTERIRWHTEALHEYFPEGWLTSTLVADHPYFGGTGLGMGMEPNFTWGGAPLALDWFDLARRKAVDLIGIEDWMGLQYMYGPSSTWEGFQLMGFQASMFRSGRRGTLPIIAWITPSDETNLRLKSASALCQGAKHFYYWTYGPTAFGTENYWSDLRGEYDGVARIARQLAAAEHVLAPGQIRPTRVALLYSISSDLWQPFGYIHMLERRATYLSLVHNQYLVDMLTEEDVEAGRLDEYDVLYATDPCISAKAASRIEEWVRAGGHLYGTCAAATRNEFNEPVQGLAEVFGIEPEVKVAVQAGEYRIRGSLNSIDYTDAVQFLGDTPFDSTTTMGVIGVRADFSTTTARVVGTFAETGRPAATVNYFGKGMSVFIGACPGLAYLKEAKFVPDKLAEKYPSKERGIINAVANQSGVPRLVELSHPVVEAGVYDTPDATALVLANFTYEPIERLVVRLPLARPAKSVQSVEKGPLDFSLEKSSERYADAGFQWMAVFKLELGLNDIVLVE